ncbi:MAG: hypothetical protein ACRDKE_00995, partial [Solirubrobacterales bacterium]
MFKFGSLLAVVFALVVAAPASAAVTSTEPDTSVYVTDGVVNALQQVGDRMYVGGAFDHVGVRVGNALSFSTATGLRDASFPEVAGGEIDAAISDGSGGWYVGGSFTSIGGEPQDRLAHVLANNSVDVTFDPVINDGSVMSLALVASTLYVGGNIGGI